MTLIIFEGNEGTGKTTQIEKISQRLQTLGKNVHITREPGGTPFAENIRALFKAIPEHDHPTSLTELLLVTAARAQHCEMKLRPLLAKNEIILCDRFIDSTYVYQGYVGGLSLETIQTISKPAVQDVFPAIVFCFDMTVDQIQQRINSRNNAAGKPVIKDRNDEKGRDTLEKWAAGYRWLAKSQVPYPNGRIPYRVLIDAHQSPDDVEKDLLSELKKACPDLGL